MGLNEARREHFVKIIMPIPKHAQKFPIFGVNRKKSKSWFYVSFGHKTICPKPLDSPNCIIDGDVLKGKIILVDKMVYAWGPWFGEGQIKYGSECLWMFLGDKANRGDLEILKGGGEWKGPMVRPLFTSSVKLEVTTSGFREAVGKFLEKRKCLGPE